MVDLCKRPGTDMLFTEKNSVYIFFMPSQHLEISQWNFETLIKDSKETFLHPFS